MNSEVWMYILPSHNIVIPHLRGSLSWRIKSLNITYLLVSENGLSLSINDLQTLWYTIMQCLLNNGCVWFCCSDIYLTVTRVGTQERSDQVYLWWIVSLPFSCRSVSLFHCSGSMCTEVRGQWGSGLAVQHA